jgi:hypothetical protein
MITPRIASLTAMLFLATPTGLLAQRDLPVRPGDRVRLSAPSHGVERLEGTVISLMPDTIVVDRGEPLALPISSLTRLAVSRDGKSRTRAGATVGFWAGAVAGAAIGVASAGPSNPLSSDPNEAAGLFVGSALAGGVVGLGLGALIGSTIKVHRWEAVPLHRVRVHVVANRGRGLAVSASLVF